MGGGTDPPPKDGKRESQGQQVKPRTHSHQPQVKGQERGAVTRTLSLEKQVDRENLGSAN